MKPTPVTSSPTSKWLISFQLEVEWNFQCPAYSLSATSPAEHSRLYDQHLALVALMNGRIVHAPVYNPTIVLDIGCGTGIVTRYFGNTKFPNAAHIYGIDLCQVPAPPLGESSAPNVAFIRGNFRNLSGKDARLRSGSAAYIYSRLLECGMTDWPGYVSEIFKTLKPGGWVEMGDFIEDIFFSDHRTIKPQSDWEWLRAIRTGGQRQGLDLDAGRNQSQYLESVGFVDVQRWEYKVPFWTGAEAELPGSKKMTEHVIGDKWGLYWHMIPKLLEGMEYGKGDIDRLRREMVSDLSEEEGKYQIFCVTIGRKPDTQNVLH